MSLEEFSHQLLGIIQVVGGDEQEPVNNALDLSTNRTRSGAAAFMNALIAHLKPWIYTNSTATDDDNLLKTALHRCLEEMEDKMITIWWRCCRSLFIAATSSRPVIFPMLLLPQMMMRTSGAVCSLKDWWKKGSSFHHLRPPEPNHQTLASRPTLDPMVSLALCHIGYSCPQLSIYFPLWNKRPFTFFFF